MINTLSLWFDASDPTTITQSGGLVSQWRDKSSNAYSVSQATGSNQPTYATNLLNGLPGIQLSASTYLYQIGSSMPNFSSAAATTVYIVAKNGTTLGSGWNILNTLWFTGAGGGTQRYHFSFAYGATSGITLFVNSAAVASPSSYVVPSNTNAIIGFAASASSNYIYYNGSNTAYSSAAAPVSANDSTWFIFGDARFSNVVTDENIYEFLGFNSILTTSQRALVEGYLATKWGLQSSLSNGHPFKTTPLYTIPTVITPVPYPTSVVSSPEFDPRLIPSCVLWLDGQDLTTLFQNTAGTTPVTASSQVVQLWRDKSSTGNNATSSSSSMTYSQNGVYFPGTQTTGLSLSASQLPNGTADSTWFFVINATTSSTVVFMGAGSSGAGLRQFYLAGGNLQADKSGVGGISGTVAANTGSNVIFSCLQSQTTTTLTGWQNGAQFGTTSFSFNIGTTAATIGSDLGSYIYTGYVGELLVYGATLSAVQRQQVEAYLAKKWSLSSVLSTQNQFAPGSKLSIANIRATQMLMSRAAKISTFVPTQIAGLVGWFDAADITTMTLSGSSVTQWRDKSVQANTATNSGNYPTLAQNAMNNRNVLVFSGSQYLTFTASLLPNGSTQNSIFIVSKQTAGNLAVCFSYGSVVGGSCLQIYYAGNVLNIDFYGASASYDNVSVAGVANIIEGVFTTTNTGYRNGIPFTTNNTSLTLSTGTTFGYIGVGQSAGSLNYYLTGQIAEIVSFNTALTTEQRQQIEGYLAWKWGLKTSLSADHPNRFMPSVPS